MSRSKYYQYYVEGKDEEKLIKILKTDMQLIIPGKVQVYNVIEKRITELQLMVLKPNTTVVLVFDTDTGNDIVLRENIKMLNKCKAVNSVICVTQVFNLEDELIRSCDIRTIKELTGSKTNSEFKRDFIMESNLKQKLKKYKFDFSKFWSESPPNTYKNILNQADRIKRDKR